jgi:TetR/AcrR family transcriptional regulator
MNHSPSIRKDSHRTRAAILDAAERVFAEHGFDGARIDHIAEISGYNKTLIFRYFIDKLNLYAEVLKRIDTQMSESLAQVAIPLVVNETIVTDTQKFREFLKTALEELFDFMMAHPQIMRMIMWEHAEGWQTYNRLASLFKVEGFEQLEKIFARARAAGVLRSNFDPILLLLLAEQICWIYPTSLPYYHLVLPDRDLTGDGMPARYREQMIDFIIGGLIMDPQDPNPDARSGEGSESR